MSDKNGQPLLPPHYFQLQQPGFSDPTDPERPNRLCICLSDLHFTDGTVGQQSAEKDSWAVVFDRIKSMCVNDAIEELFLILDGDVADMLRSARWAEKGVYPWEREEKQEQFQQVMNEIMQGIIDKHAKKGKKSRRKNEKDTADGFFYRLQQLPNELVGENKKFNNKKSCVKRIQLLALLGNHDKELLADEAVLSTFYEKCLGKNMGLLTSEYREWIDRMYGKPETSQVSSVPELPFYWGDPGFRFFVTHGQWRDAVNNRAIEAAGGRPGWKNADGWKPDIWRSIAYAPFREPCFGDTIAAGLLSGFIHRSTERLEKIRKTASANDIEEINRLEHLIAELDLYRPNYLAVQRIIRETYRLRQKGVSDAITEAIETELIDSLDQWLNWPFTLEHATWKLRWGLRGAYTLASLVGKLGNGALLRFVGGLLRIKKYWDRFKGAGKAPAFHIMQTFPTFTAPYREYGFRIHGEGHTHIALEADLKFSSPADRKAYSYINFGCWRNRVLEAQPDSYRKRGIGRTLSIYDLKPRKGETDRVFSYWVEDMLNWRDEYDRLKS